MWGFFLGLILGAAAKAIYDLFREEPLPEGMGLNAGRIEAMLDETRQSIRDLRGEVRQVLSSEGTAQEKAGRLLSTATAAVKSARETAAREEAAARDEHLMVTSSGTEGAAEESATSAGQGATGSSGTPATGSSPSGTHSISVTPLNPAGTAPSP